MDDFITATELAEVLKMGRSKAYRVLKTCNSELESKGYLVFPGRAPRAYVLWRVGVAPRPDALAET